MSFNSFWDNFLIWINSESEMNWISISLINISIIKSIEEKAITNYNGLYWIVRAMANTVLVIKGMQNASHSSKCKPTTHFLDCHLLWISLLMNRTTDALIKKFFSLYAVLMLCSLYWKRYYLSFNVCVLYTDISRFHHYYKGDSFLRFFSCFY